MATTRGRGRRRARAGWTLMVGLALAAAPLLSVARAQADDDDDDDDRVRGPDRVSVTGRVWRDDDIDGTIDPSEFGVGGLNVRMTAQNGDVVTSITRSDGIYSIQVDRRDGPAWRIEIQAPSTYEASALANGNVSTVQFLTIPTTATGTVAAGNTALVDRRFLPAAIECYSGYLTNYTDDSVRRFGPPAAGTGLGAPLQPGPGGSGATAWAPAGGDMEEPMALTLGPEGDLWVGEEGEDEVARFNGNTGAYRGDIEGWNMDDTRGVTFGIDGYLYIADTDDRRVYWYDPIEDDGGTYANTNEFNLGGGDNRRPEQGVAWRNGLLYVATGPAPGKVLEIAPTSRYGGRYTGRSWVLDQVARGMHVGPDNLLYVATGDMTATGALWRIDPTANTSTRLLTGPSFTDATFGPDNSLFLVENVSGRVRRYAWPALTPMADYLPNAGTGGYTHSQPRALLWWRGTNACATETRTYEIANRVWSDLDGDGVQDPQEPGVPTVTVRLYETGPDNTFGTPDDVLAATTTTDYRGSYRFGARPDGKRYRIEFSGGVLPWATLTTANTGGNDRLDSDATTVGGRHVIELTTGPTMVEGHSFDAGFRLAPLNVGGVLFHDVNNNGTKDAGDGAALAFNDVSILNEAGLLVQTVRADANARYLAFGLTAGNYRVRVVAAAAGPDATWRSSTGRQGSTTGPYEPAPDPDNNIANVDDGTLDVGNVATDTALVTLASGTEPTTDGDGSNGNLTVDLGFFRPGSIGDRVWSDDNRNGQQDVGEGAVLGTVTVQLRDSTGATVASTTTAADGSYSFPTVSAGTYTLRFVLPSGFAVAPRDVGDDATDSDIDNTGTTGPVVVVAGSATNTIDAGLLGATLGDRVFNDLNDNGRRDALEPGFGSVPVQLLDATNAVVNNTTAALDGTFRFRGLPSGTYRVRIPFDAVYQGVAIGFVSSVGSIANHGTSPFEPAPDPDDDVNEDDNGSADWTSGHITSEPVSLTVAAEPTAEDGDAYSNLTVDFGLHQPEGLATPDNYAATVLADAPVGYWRLNDLSASAVASDASGFNRHGAYSGSVTKEQPGAIAGDTDKSALFSSATVQKVNLSSLPVNTAPGAKTTVEFWMYWTGTQNQMPFGFNIYDLWFSSNRLGFNSGCSDVYGVPSAGLANRWVHVAAVFTNANTSANKLYIDGTANPLAGTISCNQSVTANASISGWRTNTGYIFGGRIDDVSIYNGELGADAIARHYTAGSGLVPPPPNNFTISTVAGNGTTSGGAAGTGDGGPATAAAINLPSAIDAAPDGTIYFTNWGRLKKVTPAGVISTLTTVDANWNGVSIGPDGYVYVAEYGSCVIRRVNATTGASTVWAGAAGVCSTSGDGGPSASARFNRPMDLSWDTAGNLYVSEYAGGRIRKIAAGTGIITTFAIVASPWGVATDGAGNVWTATWGPSATTISRISPAGTVTAYPVGSYAMGLDVRDDGAVFFATYYNCAVRRLYNGVVTTVTENACGYGGDGGPGATARLSYPTDVAIAGSTIFVTDRNNARVRKYG